MMAWGLVVLIIFTLLNYRGFYAIPFAQDAPFQKERSIVAKWDLLMETCDTVSYTHLESCEYQRHFLAYKPQYAIITNIELDHVDYYKNMEDYRDAFETLSLIHISSVYEKLDTKAQMFEMIMMSLRMKQGISRQAFFERFGKDISEVYGSIIEKQKEKGLLLVDEEKIWASERGFHLLNDVLVEFLGDDKAHG